MKILLTGGTGLIGQMFIKAVLEKEHELIVLSRKKRQSSHRLTYAVWNPEDETSIVSEADGVDAVVNLAGEPIAAKRWSKAQKEKMLTSRVNATQILARSIQKASKKPSVFINASAIGFYGPRGNELLDEAAPAGSGFLTDLCKAWEAHAIRVADFGVRVVRLRIGIVLAREGGALQKMLPPFQLGIGGWLGSGNQWMSWIHVRDVVRLILFCLKTNRIQGAVNATAPQPVTNKAFSMVLAQTIHRPCVAPVPEFALKLLLGEMAALLLTGQRVIPKKASELGFSFRHSDIRNALESLLVKTQ